MARFRSDAGTPGASGESTAGRPGAVPPPAGGPTRVLLVDSDARVRSALRQTIALESDLTVVADAAGADHARLAAERTLPSVALVELLLPDTATGLALVRALTARPGCAVVAMSMRGGLGSAAREAGAVAFVDKGVHIDAVLDAVRAASRGRADHHVI